MYLCNVVSELLTRTPVREKSNFSVLKKYKKTIFFVFLSSNIESKQCFPKLSRSALLPTPFSEVICLYCSQIDLSHICILFGKSPNVPADFFLSNVFSLWYTILWILDKCMESGIHCPNTIENSFTLVKFPFSVTFSKLLPHPW